MSLQKIKSQVPDWTEDESRKANELSRKKKRARQRSSEVSYASTEYWNHAVDEIVADKVLLDLR